jgi:Fe-S-cluster containining protein
MIKKCLRCGRCCDNYLGIVPKTKKDNLSPAFLKKMDFKTAQEYIEKHSELMGHPCKWLQKGRPAKCTVYSNRSSDCRNYPEGEGVCRVGEYENNC